MTDGGIHVVLSIHGDDSLGVVTGSASR
jgi:hypothetical protein